MDDIFPNDEVFYRRVRSKPELFQDGRPSSAIFKDSRGVSVDIKGGRAIAEVILDEERLHKENLNQNSSARYKTHPKEFQLKAIISVDMELCKKEKLYILPDKVPGNPYHALIQRTEEIVILTKHQARELAKNAVIEKVYEVVS